MPNVNEMHRVRIERGEQLVTALRQHVSKTDKTRILREIRKIERECGVELYGNYNAR